MTSYVLDASVILKWVVGDDRESDQGRALSLLNAWVGGAVDLSAPSIWQYEVGNFLGRELPEQAVEKMQILHNLGLGGVELTPSFYQRCFQWMKEKGVTFYDAAYLAAAFELEAILVTADARFFRKMGRMDRICLLKTLVLDSG